MIKVVVKGVAGLSEVLGKTEQEVILKEGSTLRDLQEKLKENYGPVFEKKLCDDQSGSLCCDFRLLLNGRDIQFLNGLDTELKDGDRFSIIPPLAGGG